MALKRSDHIKLSSFAALLVAFLLVDCSRSFASNSTGGIDVNAGTNSESSVATPWPTYLASDYDRPGHPTLTVKQVGVIRLALVTVMPCQRAILRYAFPSNPDYLPFVLFFEEPYEAPRPSKAPHVFWTSRTYYNQNDGEVITASTDSESVSDNIKHDIDQRGCTPAVPVILLGSWDCVTDSGVRTVYHFVDSHTGSRKSVSSSEPFIYQYYAGQRLLQFGYWHGQETAQNVTLDARAMAMVVSGNYHEGSSAAIPSQTQLACIKHTN
jgi:hypothetical protein